MIGAGLSFLDSAMSVVLNDVLRLLIWAIAGGVVSMGVYGLCSPQKKLADLERRAKEAQKALAAHEGDFAQARQLMGQSLGLSLKRLGLATAPALLAGLPMLVLIVWMSDVYSYQLPQPGDSVAIEVEGGPVQAAWRPASAASFDADTGRWQIDWPRAGQTVQLLDAANVEIMQLPPLAPCATVTQAGPWNLLFANPAGYIPDDATITAVRFHYPERQILGFGPSWVRSWMTTFLFAVTVAALVIKVVFKIR